MQPHIPAIMDDEDVTCTRIGSVDRNSRTNPGPRDFKDPNVSGGITRFKKKLNEMFTNGMMGAESELWTIEDLDGSTSLQTTMVWTFKHPKVGETEWAFGDKKNPTVKTLRTRCVQIVETPMHIVGENSSEIEIHFLENEADWPDPDRSLINNYSDDPEGLHEIFHYERFLVKDVGIARDEVINEIKRMVFPCTKLDPDYDSWVNRMVDWCVKEGFPYPHKRINHDMVRRSYEELKRYSRIDTTNVFSPREGGGNAPIDFFHDSIYDCFRKDNMSPREAWNHPEMLRECVENRFIYVPEVNPVRVLHGLTIMKLAQKVSVFTAGLAKRLIENFLGKYDVIFDPFSGFSGRMLGACASGKRYIGRDINPVTVKESNEIIKFLKLNAEVKIEDVEKGKGSYPCLFTCPPYGTIEIYGKVVPKYDTTEKFVDICLERYKCKDYLFVIDGKVTKYDKYMVGKIVNKGHMVVASHDEDREDVNYEKVILISKP